MSVSPASRIPEGDLVRCLAALGALHQGDHAVEEALAGFLSDLDYDAVGEHPRAARDRAAIPAGLADHGRRLAGHGGLVDRGDSLDYGPVAGDQLARLDHHHVAAAKLRRRLLAAVAQPRDRLGAHRPERCGLGLAAPLGERLGEVGEHHREPQPDRHAEGEPGRFVATA
jgi:hypothetical protein